MKCKTIQDFFKMFPTNEACLDHIMEVQYGKRSECNKCKKETKFHRVTSQRAYVCQFCGHHLYPCVGTPFEGSRTSLQLWFFAMYLFTSTRSGVSAKELQRQLGVTYKCAWRMGHEIRKHMSTIDGEDMLHGIVEIDETLIGGKRKGKRGRGADGKTVVFGMLEKDGDVMTKVVPNVKSKTLNPIIHENVEKGTEIQTDELKSYNGLNKRGYSHNTVNHSEEQYVDGDTHVNSIEGYWSRLKNSIKGTHVHVSGKHLDKYAKEFEYRYNSRQNPEQMFPELLSCFDK
jgi:transposase